MKPPFKDMRRRLLISPLAAVIMAAAAYAVFFSLVSLEKYRAFAFVDYDFALNIQKYWNIIHADGRMSLIGDVNIWGNSLEVIAYPLGALYFLLFSSPEALLVLRALILGAVAIPIFLISRKVINERWSACLAVSYLLNPALWYMNLTEYYDMTFCVLTLTLAFYHIKKPNFRLFMLFVVLSLSIRADIALATFMLGIYAFIEKKPLKWTVAPIALSLLWIIIGMFLVRPNIHPAIAYESFYSSPAGNFLGFAKQNTIFVLQLLLPVAFLSVAGIKELLLCAPTALQHMISSKYLEHTIYAYYTAALLPFIYISSAYGLSKIAARDKSGLGRYGGLIPALLIALPLSANLWYGPIQKAPAYIALFAFEDSDTERAEFVRRIPQNAPVITTFEFTSHLANRSRLYSFHHVTSGPGRLPYPGYRLPGGIEYALIDFRDPQTLLYFTGQDSDLRIREFLEDADFGAVDSFDTVVLFKKGHKEGQKLYEPGVTGYSDAAQIINAGGKLALLWYEIKPEGRYLNIKLCWQCLGKIEDDVWMLFRVLDSSGKQVSVKAKPACYGIYPSYRWAKGEKVIDNYKMLLPEGVQASGTLYLGMSLFSGKSNKSILFSAFGGKSVVEGQEIVYFKLGQGAR